MIVRNSLSVRGEVLTEERPMGEAQKGEEPMPMEEVPTAKVLTKQARMEELMEEITAPLRWEQASFNNPSRQGLHCIIIPYNYYMYCSIYFFFFFLYRTPNLHLTYLLHEPKQLSKIVDDDDDGIFDQIRTDMLRNKRGAI